jgi:plasmid stabilization system protein ParE
MPKSWSAKRERQYEHIKDSEKQEGRSTKRAEEIAARTVNKQRAQSGETRSSSRSGGSSSRGGGRTKEQLYNEAKRLGIEGRSRMNKEQLRRAVSRKK